MEDNIKFIPDEELVPIHVMQSFSQVVDWGLMQSSIPEAWKYTMGEGINVAILDTGIAEHPDMEGALLPPLNFSGENDHIDRNGHGCIAPTDKIFIDGEGVMSIENLYNKTPADSLYINYKDGFTIKQTEKQNISVLSYNNGNFEMNKVKAIHELVHIGEIYKVSTATANISLTPWHPVYIKDGKSYKKIKAEELKVGDNIYTVTPTNFNSQYKKLLYKTEYHCKYCNHIIKNIERAECNKCHKPNWQNKIDTYIDLDEDLAFLCGLIISDGHIMKLENSIEFSGNDEKLIDIFSDLLENIFNIKARKLNDRIKCHRVRARGIHIKPFFVDQIGIPSGNKSLTVRLPDVFKSCSDSVFSAFIAGIIEGDGHVNKSDWRIRICSGSKQFVDDLQMHFRFRGIKSSIHSFNQKWTTNLGYHIKFSATPLIAKYLKIKTSDRFIPVAKNYEQIKDISVDIYQNKLYDLTVENTSNYVANGFVVSNTHCASIVAARNNELGMVGVAPGCNIISVKVLGNNGSGSYDGIIAGIQGAMDAGADIISMSLGSPTEAPNALHEKIKEATNRGIIVLAAAGNDAGRTNYPARYDEVIAVAALDRTGNLAHFSSRSDEVDAVAPGVDIYACHLNRGYAKLNGTSQACPFMAGVCALLLAWSRKTPDVPLIKNYQEMLQRLDDVCDKDSNNVALGRNGEWGFGIPSFANNKFRP
jgi:intein/homing endonuclease